MLSGFENLATIAAIRLWARHCTWNSSFSPSPQLNPSSYPPVGGLSWSRLTWPIQSGSPEFSLFPSGCGFAVGLILLLLSHNTLVPCGDRKDFSNSNSSYSSVLTETKTNWKFSRGILKFHSHTFRHSVLEGHYCPLQWVFTSVSAMYVLNLCPRDLESLSERQNFRQIELFWWSKKLT